MQSYKNKNYKLIKYGTVKEDKTYNLYKIIINNNSKKTLLITTGFHGEEFNGPISIAKIFNEITEYSQKKKVNLIIYLCINPSGFEHHSMYNFSNERSNNDFIRYKKNGKWISFLSTRPKPNNFKIITPNAKESKLILKEILKNNLLPIGFIDVHQDDYLSTGDFYTYISNKRKLYEKIMKKLDKIAFRSRNAITMNYDDNGNEITEIIDKDGFRETFDSGLSDLFHNLGSEFSITVETNVKTTLKKVEQINKIWIKNIIDLIAKSKKVDSKLSSRRGGAKRSRQ